MNINNIYQIIAQRHGVSVEEVEREIQAALQAAWGNPSKDDSAKVLQKRIAPDGKPPSPEKFIQSVLEEIDTKK